MSSQSFDRVVEYDMDWIGENLREAIGIEREVAFFARDPELLLTQKNMNCTNLTP
jgi:hypothetical protein